MTRSGCSLINFLTARAQTRIYRHRSLERDKKRIIMMHSWTEILTSTRPGRTPKSQRQIQVAALIFGFLFIALIFSVNANAHPANSNDIIRGQIINEGGVSDLQLKTETLDVYKISGSQTLTARLRKLKNGDFIVATGVLYASEYAAGPQPEQKTAFLDSIQTVGLQELLGLWRSSRWEVFEFQDFSRLNLYLTHSDGQSDPSFSRTHELSYAITLENSADYSIFISDNLKKVMAGSLHMSGAGETESLTLTLFDPATGQVAEKISLSPLMLK
jgi:hypothetical protein